MCDIQLKYFEKYLPLNVDRRQIDMAGGCQKQMRTLYDKCVYTFNGQAKYILCVHPTIPCIFMLIDTS